MITREDIRKSIKDREDRELRFGLEYKLEYPCDINVEQLSWMRPESASWYIEQLVSDAGNWDAFYYLTTYDKYNDMIVMMYELSYSYNIEDESELIDLIEEFEEIYNAYMDRSAEMYLYYKKYDNAKDSKGKD